MTYPVGLEVKIVARKKKPHNWNNHMMALGGRICHITNTGLADAPDTLYHYHVDISTYLWRHIDLIPTKSIKLDPNRAFRYKKHGH